MELPCRGVVTYPPLESGSLDFRLEDLLVRDISEDECLVEVVATGLCHTDLEIASRPDSIFPRVLGHEGAGYLKKIGSSVSRSSMSLQEGDPVLLSIAFCQSCPSCQSGHPSYCHSALKLNFGHPGRNSYKTQVETGKCAAVTGGFFGQSSLGNLAIVNPSCIVSLADILKSRDELKILAPLGCGFQTGAGTVLNLGKAVPSDSVVIIGAGGVGLAGVMAAKIIGCQKVIVIDKIPDRLALAKDLGASHTINSNALSGNLEDAVRSVTGGLGSSLTVDTTGNISVLRSALDMTGILGRVILLGMSRQSIDIDITKFKLSGKVLLGSVQGDVVPSQASFFQAVCSTPALTRAQKFIPQMVKWYRAGSFPIDRLIRFYKPSEITTAIEDMQNGRAVKPVILW